jgi:hypothetical protein
LVEKRKIRRRAIEEFSKFSTAPSVNRNAALQSKGTETDVDIRWAIFSVLFLADVLLFEEFFITPSRKEYLPKLKGIC